MAFPHAYIEIHVINLRPELIPWYERQGYTIVGTAPFEAPEIMEAGYEDRIQFVVMKKDLPR